MSSSYAGPSLEVREVILRLERSVDDGKLRLRGACDAADAAAVNVKSHGRAVQVDPVKPKLKAPGTKHLKLKCDGPLS